MTMPFIGLPYFAASFIDDLDWSIGISIQFIENVKPLPKAFLKSLENNFEDTSQIRFTVIYKRAVVFWYQSPDKRPVIIGLLWQINDESGIFQSILLFDNNILKLKKKDLRELSEVITHPGEDIEYKILVDYDVQLTFSYEKIDPRWGGNDKLVVILVDEYDDKKFNEDSTNIYFEGVKPYSKIWFIKRNRPSYF